MSGEVLVKGKYIIYKVDSRRLAESKSGNDVLVQFKIQDSRFKIQDWGLRAVIFPLSTFISYKTPVTGASFHQSRKAEERSLKTNLSVEMPISTRFRLTVA